MTLPRINASALKTANDANFAHFEERNVNKINARAISGFGLFRMAALIPNKNTFTVPLEC
jgi:hypothetical protein